MRLFNSTKLLLLPLIFIISSACSQKSFEMRMLERIPQLYRAEAETAIKLGAENKKELLAAIAKCPEKQLDALGFLLANMPERDLKELSAEFVLKNIKLAYLAMDSIKWAENIPNDIFLNYILPYVNLHERRDDWREDFFARFLPLVIGLKTPGEAAVKLNDEIWDIVNVHYSTKRKKADQSPYESMESGLASCTGLSIILVDACRAAGIPARFVGVPLWADHSGNHSWVEISDDGWHFIGAGESGELNKTWFAERAELSNDSKWKYSIYAASFKKTNVIYPPLFDTTAVYVYGDIVTDRYSKQIRDDGHTALAIRLFKHKSGPRIKGKITVLQDGKLIGEGYTRDETSDFNDFLIINLKPNGAYQIQVEAEGKIKEEKITAGSDKYQFYEVYLDD